MHVRGDAMTVIYRKPIDQHCICPSVSFLGGRANFTVTTLFSFSQLVDSVGIVFVEAGFKKKIKWEGGVYSGPSTPRTSPLLDSCRHQVTE